MAGLVACDRADPDVSGGADGSDTSQVAVAPTADDAGAGAGTGAGEAGTVGASDLTDADLGSLRAENVARVLPWRTQRLDRGERPGGTEISTPSAPARPDPEALPPPPANAILTGVEIEEVGDFDRVIFTFANDGELPPYHLSFVDAPPIECGSGREVQPGGEGWLFVQLLGTQAHDEVGESTIPRENRAPGLPNLKELRLTCDFEATVEWVIATAEARPYRVIEARNPARLVVDVQH